MFNRKRDRINDQVWEIEYQRGRVQDMQDYWQERYDTQSMRQQELHEIIDGSATEIKTLKQEVAGYVETWEVHDVLYSERDEDYQRHEIDRSIRVFEHKEDAIHYGRTLRIDLGLEDENRYLTYKRVRTATRAVNRDGDLIGGLPTSVLYGSPFFVGS